MSILVKLIKVLTPLIATCILIYILTAPVLKLNFTSSQVIKGIEIYNKDKVIDLIETKTVFSTYLNKVDVSLNDISIEAEHGDSIDKEYKTMYAMVIILVIITFLQLLNVLFIQHSLLGDIIGGVIVLLSLIVIIIFSVTLKEFDVKYIKKTGYLQYAEDTAKPTFTPAGILLLAILSILVIKELVLNTGINNLTKIAVKNLKTL